jgi:hypothetical protein
MEIRHYYSKLKEKSSTKLIRLLAELLALNGHILKP